jgi:hypothetical protein
LDLVASEPAEIPSKFIAQWKDAGERADSAAAMACLSEDVELVSPLTAQFRFKGIEQMQDVIVSAFEVITGIKYHTDVGDGDTRALFYTAQIRGIDFEEAQLLRLDPEGRIRELTLFGRPLPALTAMMAGMGPRLIRRQGNENLAPWMGAAVAPLSFLTKFGERRLVPLSDPNRNGGGSDRRSRT